MLSGFNRDAEVSGSEFAFIGGSAMAGWGYTNALDDPGVPAGMVRRARSRGVCLW